MKDLSYSWSKFSIFFDIFKDFSIDETVPDFSKKIFEMLKIEMQMIKWFLKDKNQLEHSPNFMKQNLKTWRLRVQCEKYNTCCK